jgi:uncharacterized protein (DUF2141 family)
MLFFLSIEPAGFLTKTITLILLMKNVIAFVLFYVLVQTSHGQNQVTAQVENFKNDKGVCQACIFNSAASFAKMDAFQCVTTKITNGKSAISFTNLPDGTYAIFVFHDLNSNNKMDRNFFGIPKENYGASANNLPFASSPKFSENKFVLTNNASLNLNIKLRKM